MQRDKIIGELRQVVDAGAGQQVMPDRKPRPSLVDVHRC